MNITEILQSHVQSAAPVLEDTTRTVARSFDPATIDRLKADPRLDYGQGPMVISLWERFKEWLGQLLSHIFEMGTPGNGFTILVIIVSVLILAYVILRLLRIDALRIFYKGSDEGRMGPVLFTEDIRRMDFEAMIREASARGDYRTAVRLVFLHSLRVLSEAHRVVWHPGKTNLDYLNELNGSPLQQGFRRLNRYFEYAWYGNFAMEAKDLDHVQEVFSHWRKDIQ